MAKIRARLRELRNADVRFLSLVDRAATRMPFRVLKRQKETEMGVDLSRVFKGEDVKKIEVAAVVVYAQKNDATSEQVRQSLAAAGFKTDTVRKSDDETVVFGQGSYPEKDIRIIRLSDQMVLAVKGLPDVPGIYGDFIKENAFYPGLGMAMNVLHDRVADLVTKMEAPGAAIEKALGEFTNYAQMLTTLPAACFKADAAVTTVVQAAQDAEVKTETVKKEDVVQKCGMTKDDLVAKGMTSEEADTYLTLHNKMAGDTVKEETKVEKTDDKKEEKVEEKVEPKVEDVKKEDVKKTDEPSDFDKMMLAIKGVQDHVDKKIGEVAEKVETVVQKQATQEKVLADVVQKAETLDNTLKTTVTAPARGEDKPRHDADVKKQDSDWRTGVFDTAFPRRA